MDYEPLLQSKTHRSETSKLSKKLSLITIGRMAACVRSRGLLPQLASPICEGHVTTLPPCSLGRLSTWLLCTPTGFRLARPCKVTSRFTPCVACGTNSRMNHRTPEQLTAAPFRRTSPRSQAGQDRGDETGAVIGCVVVLRRSLS